MRQSKDANNCGLASESLSVSVDADANQCLNRVVLAIVVGSRLP